MKNKMKCLTGSLCILFAVCAQAANAQTHNKKAISNTKTGGSVKSVPAKENYLTHQIAKTGSGDHGIFYDTLAGKIKPSDPVSQAGKQFQDIHLTLGAGDAFITEIHSNGDVDVPSLSLFSNVNGHLNLIKTIIDTSISFRISYKAGEAGIYTLRIACKKKAPKDKYTTKYYYENNASYNLYSVIATPESGLVNADQAICDQVQFLLRQRLSNYMQITGAPVDTAMDSDDAKKISSVSHSTLLTFDKNSRATISVYSGSFRTFFSQQLFYKKKGDSKKAQQYFISNFKNCLDSSWVGEDDPAQAGWYHFKKEGDTDITIILNPASIHIIM